MYFVQDMAAKVRYWFTDQSDALAKCSELDDWMTGDLPETHPTLWYRLHFNGEVEDLGNPARYVAAMCTRYGKGDGFGILDTRTGHLIEDDNGQVISMRVPLNAVHMAATMTKRSA